MHLEKIEDILVNRDGMSPEDAIAEVAEARRRVRRGENPEDILFEDFGLEPDYIFQLV